MWSCLFGRRTVVAAIERRAVKRAIAGVIRAGSNYDSVPLERIRAFEHSLSSRLGAPVLGTGSGTDALILSLKALGVSPGDEVIVPAFGCIPVASAVSWAGAKPIFADIRENDYAIDPGETEKNIGPKTKAVIVAHLFGQPTRSLLDVLGIAKQRGITVIEDAAQSFGARMEVNGAWKDTGTIGSIGCLSFSQTKLFSTLGNGGAVIAREPHIREEIRRTRLFGAEIPHYDHPTVGINARIQEIHAAVLLAKLPFLEYWLEHRQGLASRYAEQLSVIGGITLPREEKGTKRTWYRYVIRAKTRDRLFQHLRTTFRSIPCLKPAIHYPVPLPYFSAFKSGYARGSFPTADRVSSEVITLPLNDSMSLGDIDIVCRAVEECLDRCGSAAR